MEKGGPKAAFSGFSRCLVTLSWITGRAFPASVRKRGQQASPPVLRASLPPVRGPLQPVPPELQGQVRQALRGPPSGSPRVVPLGQLLPGCRPGHQGSAASGLGRSWSGSPARVHC